MAKKKVTIYAEEDVLRAARVAAARAGTRVSDVFEAALRRYLGFEVLDRFWARSRTGSAATRLSLTSQRENVA